jgi:hypothetical protein
VPPVAPAIPGPTIKIGEEFGTAKKNLPPARIVASAIVGVAIVVAIYSFVGRARPQGAGSLDNVAAAEIPGQGGTMVALTFTLHNSDVKTLYVRSIHGKLKTANGESSAEAVSAIDFNRYFQIFPDLKNGAQPALTPETKLQPGESVTRTAIVAFPVTLDVFNKRQSLSVVIQPYDQQVPVVLTK